MGMRISATDAANHAIQVALNRDSEKLEHENADEHRCNRERKEATLHEAREHEIAAERQTIESAILGAAMHGLSGVVLAGLSPIGRKRLESEGFEVFSVSRDVALEESLRKGVKKSKEQLKKSLYHLREILKSLPDDFELSDGAASVAVGKGLSVLEDVWRTSAIESKIDPDSLYLNICDEDFPRRYRVKQHCRNAMLAFTEISRNRIGLEQCDQAAGRCPTHLAFGYDVVWEAANTPENWIPTSSINCTFVVWLAGTDGQRFLDYVDSLVNKRSLAEHRSISMIISRAKVGAWRISKDIVCPPPKLIRQLLEVRKFKVNSNENGDDLHCILEVAW
jgi:hypothetical protein